MFNKSFLAARYVSHSVILCLKTDQKIIIKLGVLQRNFSIIHKTNNGFIGNKNFLSCTIISPKVLSNFCETTKEVKPTSEVKLENIKQQRLDTVLKNYTVAEENTQTQPPQPITIKEIKEKLLDIAKDKTKDIIPEKIVNTATAVKKRKRVDYTISTTQRNFITPVRAMSDFLLKPSDLESLPKTKRRSPYECEPPITVYWRKDVEAKAIEVWGSKENLIKERLMREIEKKRYQQNIFTVKKRLRDYRREMGSDFVVEREQTGLLSQSGKVVLTAVAINMANVIFKGLAWLYTGSHSMFSECIHSMADTVNQVILAVGIHKSVQIADSYHPYGYFKMKNVSSLISGVGIFCVGSGLSFYHGVMGIIHPEPVQDFFWAFCILGGSLVSEGATCIVALNTVRKGAKAMNISVKDYVISSQDPSVNVVLMEDLAAVTGVTIAGTCMGLATITNNSLFDACGALFVGGVLGAVASFIIYTNVAALVGRSIPLEHLERINTVLEADVMIRAIHDVKGIDMGNSLVRYKAELDFDGRELTRSYLDKQDLSAMLQEVRSYENIDQLEDFMLRHGENIIDMMGGEIDRIEMKLRKKHPEIRHCDLEIL